MSEPKPYESVNADCLEVMRKMSDNSVDAIVTDPPYGISFMSKGFDTFKKEGMSDNQAFQADMTPLFKEMLRVAKPGAHILAFGGTRTYHRLTCAIEDAGWEIRDTIMWVYGLGFPKSMNVSKAIDKKLGAQRAVRAAVGDHEGTIDFGMKNRCPKCGKPFFSANPCTCPREDLIPITEEAKKWSGWGTCLKPAYEPVIMARKPLEGTVVDTVLKYGTGGINIDECRVPTEEAVVVHSPAGKTLYDSGHKDLGTWVNNKGRFPANFIHDGSDEVLALFPDSNGSGHARTLHRSAKPELEGWGMNKQSADAVELRDAGSGSAARFFYCAKASKKEKGKENTHPTVKPIKLMKYLVKLVAPKGALVLDPFMGSGTTGVAALQVGCRFLGIEKEKEYFDIAEKRLKDAKPEDEKVV